MDGFKGQIARDKPYPNYRNVYEVVTGGEIFNHYIPDLKFEHSMKSPLGNPDSIPSFNVFWSRTKNKYMFKDHRYGWFGDAIDFVQRLYGFTNQTEACMQICADFGIEGFYVEQRFISSIITPGIKKAIPINKPRGHVKIQVTFREWNNEDIAFWKQYGITVKWLQYARIFPIKYYFINGSVKIADKYSYAYIESKDDKVTYKIYQPFAEYGRKWISNNDRSVWELWSMLPESHDFLAITKSRKDALSIMATMNIPSTSLQAEGTIPKLNVIGELKLRFKFIFLFYDNDFDKKTNYGREFGQKLSTKFDLPQIEIPEIYDEKDYSDLVKRYGINKSKVILWDLIKREILKQHFKTREMKVKTTINVT